ncbi:MAG: nuclear transport factor 2 family protein [Solirubrobacteraceae bacterium]
MSLEDDVRRLVDRQAIIDLNHHLCHLIDTFQIDRIGSEVYAEDGSDDHGVGPVRGRAAIGAWYADSTANIAAVVHNISNAVVELHGDDRATMRSNVTTWTWTMANADGDPLRNADYALSLGYVDELTRYPEGWRIDARVLVSNTSKTGDAAILAAGTLPTSQSGIHGLARRRPPGAPTA